MTKEQIKEEARKELLKNFPNIEHSGHLFVDIFWVIDGLIDKAFEEGEKKGRVITDEKAETIYQTLRYIYTSGKGHSTKNIKEVTRDLIKVLTN